MEMGKNYFLNTDVWSDEYIRSLGINGKCVFIFLLVNPFSNLSGAYQIPRKAIAPMIDLDENIVEDILKKLEADKKILFSNGYIAIKNKKNYWGKLAGKFLINVLETINECPLEIREFLDFDTLCKDYQYSIDRPLKNKEQRIKNQESPCNRLVKPSLFVAMHLFFI